MIHSILTDCEGKGKGRVKYCSDPLPRDPMFSPSHGPFKYVLHSYHLLHFVLLSTALQCFTMLCLSHLKFSSFSSSTSPFLTWQSCVTQLKTLTVLLYFVLSFPYISFVFPFYFLVFNRFYSLHTSREMISHKRCCHNFLSCFFFLNFFLYFRTVGLNILMLKKEGKGRDIPDLPLNYTLKKSFLLNKEVRT